MSYNLTDNQKALAKWIARLREGKQLSETFTITFLPAERCVILDERRYDGPIDDLDLQQVTVGSFRALAKEGLIDYEQSTPRDVKGLNASYIALETIRVTIAGRLQGAALSSFDETNTERTAVRRDKRPERFETASETYAYKGVIGEGGAGFVFEVNTANGRTFALKCLKPDSLQTSKRKRFKNELWFSRNHGHKNLIQVIDDGVTTWKEQIVPFYVMPFMATTLRKMFNDNMENERKWTVFGQILDGVEAAHLYGVVHRDLKPENILYDPSEGRIVVADFGIADFSDEHMAILHETKTGEILGNRHYLAPEQHGAGAKVDRRADIFALGLILNELFTGEVPYGRNYKTIASIAPSFGYLDLIVERMIQNSPDARFPDIDTVKKALIGRQAEFITQQRLDQLRAQVVSNGVAARVDAVEIVALDAEGGTLILKLNRKPEDGWKHLFQHVQLGGQTIIPALTPPNYQFADQTARVRVNHELRQPAIDHFKRYSKAATELYQARLDREAKEREEANRSEIVRQTREEEQRQRVLKDLSF